MNLMPESEKIYDIRNFGWDSDEVMDVDDRIDIFDSEVVEIVQKIWKFEHEDTLDDFELEQEKIKFQNDYDMASILFRWLHGKVITYRFFDKVVNFFNTGADTAKECGWFGNSQNFADFTVHCYVDMLLTEMSTDYMANASIFIAVDDDEV